MNALIKSAASLSLAAALVGPFALAHADRVGDVDGVPQIELGGVPEIVVAFDDLDISHPKGLEKLYSRIQYAAMNVCNYDRLHKELSRQRRPQACYTAAVDDAIKQINQPKLTALHKAKSKAVAG